MPFRVPLVGLVCPDFGNCLYLRQLQFSQIMPPNKYNKNNRREISQIDGGPPLSAVLSFTAGGSSWPLFNIRMTKMLNFLLPRL